MDTIEDLRARIAELEGELAYLKGEDGRIDQELGRIRVAFPVTPSEARLLHMLSDGRLKRHVYLAESTLGETANFKTMTVHIYRLRKKTRFSINVVWGRGYVLESGAAEKVRAVMRGENVVSE
jgi:DNA-binding response OmpR family regulator